MIQNQSSVKIMFGETAFEVSLVKEDEFQNYVLNFLQHYFVLLNLKDTIREGDIFRLNNILKLAMPFFFNHSSMSKYLVECIDYVLKTEIIMPPKLGMQVRTASFVNLKGRQAKNKAADMEKENQVKEIKDLIRGLGSNKTEQAIVKVTAAAPVIKEIVNKLDGQIGYIDRTSVHKKRSENDDLLMIAKVLREVRPFVKIDGRKVDESVRMKAAVFLDLKGKHVTFNEHVLNTALRLRRGLPMPEENEDAE
ncbi:hypothetical protein DPMN_144487 [Dreissena polymorpha]|uniref:DUF6589 domain-containing protein n=2 Tax=Dreissena polymorpha TaxID=45954 RepID=A0A9D4GFR0_DREPO|nr:hypothetical protein DPMN_144487 [Dreissena polymorpha]